MRPFQVFALFVGASAAWSGSDILEGSAEMAVRGLESVEQLFKRQDNNADNTDSAAATTAAASNTGDNADQTASSTGTNRNTRTGTATASRSGSASGTVTDQPAAETEFDPRLAPGGVSMMTPNVFAGAQYYKVGDWVTFGFNFTSVLATPTAVNIIASCSQNNAQYTIAANQSYSDEIKVFWDTSQRGTGTQDYITGTYTLVVENAEESRATGVPAAGYFGSWQNFQFGMYTKQAYTPWSEFNCPTCSFAMSSHEKQTLGFLFTMMSITIMSFTYFATGRFGII